MSTKVDSEPTTSSEKPWPQSADAYELKNIIGQGAFAKVYQARCESRNANVAIKIMELDNLTSSLDDIYQEVRVMLLSKNRGVLEAYACFVVKRSLWLVMPLMEKGSCLRILRCLKKAGFGEGMKEAWIAPILKSALEGLAYFHSQKKVHRDIKASNLLMDAQGNVKISDFGVSGWLPNSGVSDRGESRRTFVGTPCWMAPEVMEQSSSYDEKADIWSFGITALELAKGYAPYARHQPMKVLLMTIQQPPPSLKSYADYQDTKGKFSRHFREIITLCLQKNPAHRPSAATLLTKKFFKTAQHNNFLIKDLLERVPITDACDAFLGSAATIDEKREQEKELQVIQQQQKEEIEKQRTKEIATLQQLPKVPKVSKVLETDSASPPTSPPSTNNNNNNNNNNNVQQEQSSSSQQQNTNQQTQNSQPPLPPTISRLESMPQGSSFVKGSTWVFEDDDDQNDNNKTQQNNNKTQVTDDEPNDFDAFASEYAKMDIKGEDGK